MGGKPEAAERNRNKAITIDDNSNKLRVTRRLEVDMPITTIKTKHRANRFKRIVLNGSTIGYLEQLHDAWVVGRCIRPARQSYYLSGRHPKASAIYPAELDAIRAWCVANEICYPVE